MPGGMEVSVDLHARVRVHAVLMPPAPHRVRPSPWVHVRGVVRLCDNDSTNWASCCQPPPIRSRTLCVALLDLLAAWAVQTRPLAARPRLAALDSVDVFSIPVCRNSVGSFRCFWFRGTGSESRETKDRQTVSRPDSGPTGDYLCEYRVGAKCAVFCAALGTNCGLTRECPGYFESCVAH